MLVFDHITVAAVDIESGVAYAEKALGVPIPRGGAHPSMGTHNHLLRLGPGVFLEIIAPDPEARPRRARWFGLDDDGLRAGLAASPRLLTWVARTPGLEDALASVDGAAGPAVRVSRGDLSWLIGVPEDGSMPFDGAFPTLIEWPPGPHPSDGMADHGCRIERLIVEHPRGDQIAIALRPHMADERIVVRTGVRVRLEAVIAAPGGVRVLT
ncbi:VOC family protein [Rhodoplanes roseus]|uniref:Glyoxalase-like domain-containing protein n=1 Tax=Rhodoplanes roseus TaxID=29409 RepID=A0A327KUV2_9BRAD|nr:VOC family protein [Rhodoplanes roseus]RAI41503.1 hypothetical protein CH341_21495 [Rhodoplanes roseus]